MKFIKDFVKDLEKRLKSMKRRGKIKFKDMRRRKQGNEDGR
jgi:hypothetical protein